MDKVLLKTEIPEPRNELKSYQNWHFPEERRKEMKVLKIIIWKGFIYRKLIFKNLVERFWDTKHIPSSIQV